VTEFIIDSVIEETDFKN